MYILSPDLMVFIDVSQGCGVWASLMLFSSFMVTLSKAQNFYSLLQYFQYLNFNNSFPNLYSVEEVS